MLDYEVHPVGFDKANIDAAKVHTDSPHALYANRHATDRQTCVADMFPSNVRKYMSMRWMTSTNSWVCGPLKEQAGR